MEKNKSKIQLKLTISLIAGFFIVGFGIKNYVDVAPVKILFLYFIVTWVYYLLVGKIVSIYIKCFNFFIQCKVNSKILTKSITMSATLVLIPVFIYWASLAFFAFWFQSISVYDIASAERIWYLVDLVLPNSKLAVLILLLIGVVIAVTYQNYKLTQKKVPLRRSLLATITSMLVFIWILDIWVFFLRTMLGFL